MAAAATVEAAATTMEATAATMEAATAADSRRLHGRRYIRLWNAT